MFLDSLADPELIFPDLPAFDVESLPRTFARRIVERRGAVHSGLADPDRVFDGLWEREKLGSTGIGNGIAVPHCKLTGLESVLLAVGHVKEGIDFGAMDGAPVRLFFVVISPEAKAGEAPSSTNSMFNQRH